MAAPVVLLLVIALLVVLIVGYGVFITLPRLVWTQLHTVWRTFGRAAHSSPDPRGEPATSSYFRVVAARDLRATWWDGLERHERLMSDAERFLADRVDDVFDRPQRRGTGGRGWPMLFLRPVSLLTAVAVVLTATALSILPFLFAMLLWALGCSLWTVWWAVCAAVARTGRALRSGPAPCPYTGCGHTVHRPVRLCPTCRAAHRQLLPNRYGALSHRCRCGTRLPAVLGMRRLDARCPHCGKALPAGYERARVVVLVGGPAAQRGAVHRQGQAELGAAPGAEPPLVRTGGTPVLWYDPPGDAYGSQESVAALDVLPRARGLLLVVDDPTAHSDAVHAVTRVLHVLTALPGRRRPHRIALLYTRAAQGDDTAVRAELDAVGGGHLLRALDASGIEMRCIPAAALAGTLRWLAGTSGAAGAGESMVPPPGRRPASTTFRLPRHRAARHTLLLTHLAGYLVVPLVLVLLEAGVLPPAALLGLPGMYDKWRHPLSGSVRQVDLTAVAPGDWPEFSASYSAPGHPPSAVLPGRAGYWSFKGSPQKDNWLRMDFGIPLPLSEVSVDFDPDSVASFFVSGLDVEGQDDARTIEFRDGHPHERKDGAYLTTEYGYDYPVPDSVDSVRVGLLSGLIKDDSKDEQRLRLREVNIRWRSSDALRLHPADGGRLTLENTTARDLAITVRPPLLPKGWRATPIGRPSRTLRAHDTYEVHWRITAPEGTERRAPIAYAVDIGDGGETVTARCLAFLTASADVEPLC
ncbi:hypothetical protein [Streptomyces sp. NPDC056061]|uniref:hypothetical protein n=1 Tax=Streptomyces sp. NPDC056061 TaxID=3345700 RepID=UPI0035D770F5